MGNLPRLAIVLLAVLCAAVAVAQVQEQPPPAQGTALPESNCYRCHATGGGNLGPPLSSMYRVQVASSPLALNEPLALTVTAQNGWVAQIRDLSATLDFTDAPDAGFSGRPPPVLNATANGTLPFDPSQPLRTLGERNQTLALALPVGATAFDLRLVPDNSSGSAAPDLAMRLWAPATDTKGPPTAVVDQAGKGGTESFAVPVANGTLRSGTWTVQAAQAACTSSLDPSCAQAQGFTVAGDAWFNVTGGERLQTAPFPDAMLDGQHKATAQQTQLAWSYFLRDYTKGNESITVLVNATAHYAHPPNAARYDDWPFTQSITLPLQFLPTGGNLTTPAAPVDAKMGGTGGATLAQWGEAVGYLGGLTLLVSMASGGVFGNRFKGWMNRLYGTGVRRIAFHNAFSYGVILFAIAHLVLFVVEAEYHWSVGLLWGAPAILFMLLLGVTGAFQAAMIRWWGARAWTVLHASLSHLTILFVAVHMGLDGAHFTWIPKRLHWIDPVVHALRG